MSPILSSSHRYKHILRHIFIAVSMVTAIFTWTTIQTLLNFRSVDQQHIICPHCNPRMLSHHWLYPSNSTLLNLPRFHYLINNNVCSSSEIFLVILIHSAPEHFYYRDTIRNNWGSGEVKGYVVKTVFLLAEVQDKRLQLVLETENELHRDMVQGSFVDSYRNLTYKHVMGLQWAGTYCNQAQFILKMDDDIFVDIFQLTSLLDIRYPQQTSGNRLGKNLACYHQNKMPVVRDPLSKWYVSKEEFSPETFDNYCSGWAYVTTPATAKLLAEFAHKFPYFWVDDVLVTGTVANAAGVGRRRLNEWFTIETQSLVEWVRSKEDLMWRYVFAPTWGDMELMRLGHNRAKKCAKVKCSCCYKPPEPKVVTVSSAPVTVMGIAKLVPLGVKFHSEKVRSKKINSFKRNRNWLM